MGRSYTQWSPHEGDAHSLVGGKRMEYVWMHPRYTQAAVGRTSISSILPNYSYLILWNTHRASSFATDMQSVDQPAMSSPHAVPTNRPVHCGSLITPPSHCALALSSPLLFPPVTFPPAFLFRAAGSHEHVFRVLSSLRRGPPPLRWRRACMRCMRFVAAERGR